MDKSFLGQSMLDLAMPMILQELSNHPTYQDAVEGLATKSAEFRATLNELNEQRREKILAIDAEIEEKVHTLVTQYQGALGKAAEFFSEIGLEQVIDDYTTARDRAAAGIGTTNETAPVDPLPSPDAEAAETTAETAST